MTVEQFGKALVASGLMTADDVKAFWSAIAADARPKTDADFGKLLVERSLLTPFQVAEIIAGRGARLIMGDYTIVSQIGAGGMGQVYKAQHRRMKRTVALKVMSNAAMQDEAAVKRFQREVHAAARLEHPNIVTAYDSGEAGNVKYLVMQFVDGGDLSDLVKKNGRLGVEQAVGYVIQAARGLAFAHGEGVIHRDIKPANLLLDKKGIVKILDMGLARFEDGGDGLTATEQVMGTVDYMSPEQAANTKGCDGRADIYSLGCTLWYLLTARKLYEADTLIARLMLHRDGPLPSLVKERDDAPWPLEQALHKMIAKRAADRYQTMDEVVAALAPYGGDPSLSGSIGGSGTSAGQSADLASFMQSMGTGGTKTSHPSATQMKAAAAQPATSANLEATAQLSTADVGTDPKSQILPKGTPAAKGQPQSKKKKPGNDKTKLIAAGALGGLLLVAGIIVLIRNKDGEVVAEINVPDGGKVEVVAQPRPVTVNPTTFAPLTPSATSDIAALLESPDYIWSAPENLGPTINGPGDQLLFSLTSDQHRLYFGRKGADGQTNDVLEVVRSSLTAPFGEPKVIEEASEAFVSDDGLTIVKAGPDIAMKRRPTLDSAFGPADRLSQLNTPTSAERRPTLSPDGLTLVFSTDRAPDMKTDLWISRRKSQSESFGPAESIGPPVNTPGYEQFGTLLVDNRTLIFVRTNDNGGWLMTTTNSFGKAVAVPLPNNPFGTTLNLWLAPDGRTAYFSAELPGGFGGKDIYVTRRMPKSGATPAIASTPSFIQSLPTTVPPGVQNLPAGKWGLRFEPGQFVEAGPAPYRDTTVVTTEIWLTDESDPTLNQSVLVGGPNGYIHTSNNDSLTMYTPHRGNPEPVAMPKNQRVHIAAVNDGRGRRLYVNGKLAASSDDAGSPTSGDRDKSLPIEIGNKHRFRGVIDGVRISTTARYTADFTPDQTFTADKDTFAVYRFDEGQGNVLKDSSANGYHGRIDGANWVRGASVATAAEMPLSPGDYALRFTGENTVVAPNPRLDESQPFTVEAYITPGDINPNALFGRRLFGVDSEFHIEIKDSRWRFYSTHNEATSPERFAPSRRVHVAGVRTTTGRLLFLDGKLVASKDDPLKLASKESNSPLLLEARGPAEFTFDEFRISQGIVYDKEFAPPAKLTADANTLALYHFDEGFGDVLKDSSGKGRDGKIIGATWVKADGSPIPTASSAALQSGVGAPLDLLSLVDLGQDILAGDWSQDGAGFVSSKLKTDSWLRLPVDPGEAYSLRAAFTTERGNISFVLPFESKGLEIFLSTKRVVACIKPPNDPTNPTAIVPKELNAGKRHEVLIEVTRPSASEVKIAVVIDGAPALQWQGTRAALQGTDNRRVPVPTLSVGSFLPANGPTKLLEARITTTQGTTKPLRSTATTAATDPATIAKWLLDNKKLAKIRFEIDGKAQMLSTVPAGLFKVVELNFSKNNNAGQSLSEEEIGRLAVFTDLESLEFSTLTDAGLAKLSPLKKLKSLIVANNTLTPAAVATIRQFPQLEQLQASGDDEWLKPLAGMPTLRSMIFWKVNISPKAMSWFPQYPNLSELRLNDCFEAPGVRLSVALTPLKDCKNLKTLFLNTSKFDADALAVLSGLTGLTELDLYQSNVSEAQLKQLTAALPRCQVKWRDAANNFKQHIFEPTAPPAAP